VHIYVDGPAGSGAAGSNVGLARLTRDDVAAAYPGAGSTHGFDVLLRPIAPGTHVVYLYGINTGGGGENVLFGWAQVVVVPDITIPIVALTAPGVPFTTEASLPASWAGSDAGSGIARYQVRWRRAPYNGGFGSWVYPSVWQSLTTTSVTLSSMTPGSNYCLSVRATDNAHNTSAWSGERCTARLLDDRALAASSGWTRGSGSGYYLATITSTAGTAGRTLSRSGAQLDRVAILITKCPTCGTVAIYVGSTRMAVVSLYAATTRYSQLVVLPRFTYRTETVFIRTTTSGKTVRLDGLGISRT
jgi:hypothetical protein